jgi:uncharacterized protein (TIGR02246 family)
MGPAEQEVWRVVQAVNRAWAEGGEVERLREWFHRDMVAVTPTDRLRLEGREACVAAWSAFVAAVRITRWVERDPDVRLFADGRVAVVTYYYAAAFIADGEPTEVAGRDLMTLVREDGRWWIVADQFSGYPGGRG